MIWTFFITFLISVSEFEAEELKWTVKQSWKIILTPSTFKTTEHVFFYISAPLQNVTAEKSNSSGNILSLGKMAVNKYLIFVSICNP